MKIRMSKTAMDWANHCPGKDVVIIEEYEDGVRVAFSPADKYSLIHSITTQKSMHKLVEFYEVLGFNKEE